MPWPELRYCLGRHKKRRHIASQHPGCRIITQHGCHGFTVLAMHLMSARGAQQEWRAFESCARAICSSSGRRTGTERRVSQRWDSSNMSVQSAFI